MSINSSLTPSPEKSSTPKPIYEIAHKWDTIWLGSGISCTDIDLASQGSKYINIYEIKRRTPFLNQVQKELFIDHHLLHIVVLNMPKQGDNSQYHFEALMYEFYCPFSKQEFEYVEHRRSWNIISKPQNHVPKNEARAIFRGDAPWPCCGRPTYIRKLDRSR